MSNMAWGSGRSGYSTASRAYTPLADWKSGIPQETEICQCMYIMASMDYDLCIYNVIN